MGVGLTLHRMDEAHFIRQGGQVGDQVGNHLPTLASWTKLPGTASQRSLLALKGDELLVPRQGLPMATNEFGLVIEGVELTAATTTEDQQDILGPGLEMGIAWRIGMTRGDDRTNGVLTRHRGGQQPLTPQQMGQCNRTQANPGVGKEASPIEQRTLKRRLDRVHGMKRNSLELSSTRHSAGTPSALAKTKASFSSIRLGRRL